MRPSSRKDCYTATVQGNPNPSYVCTSKLEGVEEAFKHFYRGETIISQGPTIPLEERECVVLAMPASITPMRALGIKVVTIHPLNPAGHDLPSTLRACQPHTTQKSTFIKLL